MLDGEDLEPVDIAEHDLDAPAATRRDLGLTTTAAVLALLALPRSSPGETWNARVGNRLIWVGEAGDSVGVVLLIVVGGLVWWQVETWRARERDPVSSGEQRAAAGERGRRLRQMAAGLAAMAGVTATSAVAGTVGTAIYYWHDTYRWAYRFVGIGFDASYAAFVLVVAFVAWSLRSGAGGPPTWRDSTPRE